MKIDNILFSILVIILLLIVILIVLFTVNDLVEGIVAKYNYYKEKYDLTSAVIIDSHITYTRSGYPCYYLVYKFSDGSIRQVEVNEEFYYTNLEANFTEGSW